MPEHSKDHYAATVTTISLGIHLEECITTSTYIDLTAESVRQLLTYVVEHRSCQTDIHMASRPASVQGLVVVQ